MLAPLPDWIAALPGIDPLKNRNEVTLAGASWHNYRFADYGDDALHHHAERDGRTAIITITHPVETAYYWESALTLVEAEWYVRAAGQADNLEAAAAMALAYRHAKTTVGGLDWYSAHWHNLPETHETRIDGKRITVARQHDGSWYWVRPIDTTPLRATGISIIGDDMTGSAETAEDAMADAISAPAILRHGLRAMLKELTPRPAPEIIDFTLEPEAA